jgi:YHS domain-containing protein
LRILIWLFIGYCLYVFFKGRSRKQVTPGAPPRGEETETHKDPVCGVYVARDDAVVGNLEGNKIYFCSRDCLEKFQEQLEHT